MFKKTAKALIVKPRLDSRTWSRVRVASGSKARDLTKSASEILGEDFDPSHYLLTHATIVASVDVEGVAGIGKGAGTYKGESINRKTDKFRVTKNTSKYINNNFDCWSREVLKASYHTFVGAHNFLEHVQEESLSKGRILDAVLRDVGETLYVDILVATHRKHKDLVSKIENGSLDSLSMGCTIDGSTCTQCGNWAANESEMCSHILNNKGSTFVDEMGEERVVAELCGDISLTPNAGNTFVEGSWVGDPAFTGAVARSIIQVSPQDKQAVESLIRRASVYRSMPEGQKRSASNKVGSGFDLGLGDGSDSSDDGNSGGGASDPLTDLEGELERVVLDRVRGRIMDKISPRTRQPSGPSESNDNDTIIHSAKRREHTSKRYASLYVSAVRNIRRASSDDATFIKHLSRFHQEIGFLMPQSIYSVALKVGSTSRYPDLKSFLQRCGELMGRKPDIREAKSLVRLAKILRD